MKMLATVGMLVLSMSSFATSDSKTFFFDGSQDSVRMSLQAEETHTEYRYEQRRTVCYRQDVFYSTECHHTPQGRMCHTVPHYRTVSYPCMQTVRIPFEVKDYDVFANVDLKINALPDATHGETFKVILNGDRITLSATSTGKKYFVLQKKEETSSSVHGTQKFIDAAFSASFVEAAHVVKALSVSNMSLKSNLLTFRMGPVADRSQIGLRLTVTKAPILGSNTELFDRELTENELQLLAEGEGTNASVDLEKLGVKLTSGRYLVKATAFFKHSRDAINLQQFEKTEDSLTLTYKIR